MYSIGIISSHHTIIVEGKKNCQEKKKIKQNKREKKDTTSLILFNLLPIKGDLLIYLFALMQFIDSFIFLF
jgi:hypothetical protein